MKTAIDYYRITADIKHAASLLSGCDYIARADPLTFAEADQLAALHDEAVTKLRAILNELTK
jgi:hypothetical protein